MHLLYNYNDQFIYSYQKFPDFTLETYWDRIHKGLLHFMCIWELWNHFFGLACPSKSHLTELLRNLSDFSVSEIFMPLVSSFKSIKMDFSRSITLLKGTTREQSRTSLVSGPLASVFLPFLQTQVHPQIPALSL